MLPVDLQNGSVPVAISISISNRTVPCLGVINININTNRTNLHERFTVRTLTEPLAKTTKNPSHPRSATIVSDTPVPLHWALVSLGFFNSIQFFNSPMLTAKQTLYTPKANPNTAQKSLCNWAELGKTSNTSNTPRFFRPPVSYAKKRVGLGKDGICLYPRGFYVNLSVSMGPICSNNCDRGGRGRGSVE